MTLLTFITLLVRLSLLYLTMNMHPRDQFRPIIILVTELTRGQKRAERVSLTFASLKRTI